MRLHVVGLDGGGAASFIVLTAWRADEIEGSDSEEDGPDRIFCSTNAIYK
jgi:hypothetical protein